MTAYRPTILGRTQDIPRNCSTRASISGRPITCMASSGGNGAGNGSTPPRKLSLATLLVQTEGLVDDPYHASMPPIYQTATFGQPGATEMGEYDYSRSGNPTRTVLELAMAKLEGAERAFAFSSGMSSLAAVTRLLSVGDHIVAGDDLYGGTSRLLSRIVPNSGIDVTNVDTCDLDAVRAAIVPGKTKLVMLESPTNPRMQICDIAAIAKMAKAAGALTLVDNSIMCPLFQQTLDLGADISMTSATKFIGGHSDVMAGILAVRDPALADRIYFVQNAEGTALGPMDSWLLVRGLKTMALRMERQAQNAQRIAEWLAAHPLVKKVNFPGLPDHPGREVHFKQVRTIWKIYVYNKFMIDDFIKTSTALAPQVLLEKHSVASRLTFSLSLVLIFLTLLPSLFLRAGF